MTRSACVIFLCLMPLVDWSLGTEVDIYIEPRSEPVWFMENHSLNLTCVAKNTAQKPAWWNEGLELDKEFLTERSMPDGTIILQFFKEEANTDDVGVYRCEAGSKDIMRRVDSFTVTSRDVNLTLGFATSISCDMEPFYEGKSIRWLKGDKPVQDISDLQGRLNLSGANKTLTILNSKRSDAGLYTCIIEFNPGTDMEQTFPRKVGILGSPYMTRNLLDPDLIHVTNTSVTLECPAAGYPSPEVFWLLKDEVIQASDFYQLESVNDVPSTKLTIKDPDIKSGDTYLCTAENNMGKATMTFTIPSDNNSGYSSHTSSFWSMLLCVIVLVLKSGSEYFIKP